ncbi:MAG: dsDNA-specific endonuclease/ATPase MutS2, partial [Kiritimatiellia bacterium]
ELRIVHGKGRGHMQRSVHALLSRNEAVQRYTLADPSSGGWGATLVWLKPLD